MATKKAAKKRTTGPRVKAIVKDLLAAAETPIRTHELKCWPSPFAATIAGVKPFEIRYNDRGFLAGERIHLREWQPLDSDDKVGSYTGREVMVSIVRVDRWAFGLRDNCVAMTIAPIIEAPAT